MAAYYIVGLPVTVRKPQSSLVTIYTAGRGGRMEIYIVTHYLLICRSITYAQRTARALEKAGIGADIVRLPKNISIDGCGYCVRVKANGIYAAITAVRNAGLPPVRVFSRNDYGSYDEVTL